MPSSTSLRYLAVLLWLALLAAGWWSWQRLSSQRAVAEVCEAVASEDWATALAASEALVGSNAPGDTLGRRATECRALALMATDQVPSAVELLERQLASAGHEEWIPDPVLVLLLADDRQKSGRLPAAVELVRRATVLYPDDVDLLHLELDLRSQTEDEEQVLGNMVGRLDRMGSAAPWMALRLAQRYLGRRELAEAARLLGPAPFSAEPALRDEWFRVRAALAGTANDPAQVASVCGAWRAAGGHPAEVLAWHALTLSLYQLRDPERPTPQMLRSALERCEEIPDRSTISCSVLAHRLLGTYVVAGRTEEALALWDRWSPKVELTMSREEILRSERSRLEPTGEPLPTGRVRFVLEDGGQTVLHLSPAHEEPVDRAFEILRPGSEGTIEVSRRPGPTPLRWVARDTTGPWASGSLWPVAGETVELVLERPSRRRADEDAAADPPEHAERAFFDHPADGRRQVVVVILDCADWRLIRYLQARGELPVFERLIRRGLRAVVESRPAFTAAAMDALSHPAEPARYSPPAVLYQLGVELAANSFVGDNPFAALEWLLPERRDLFATLGAGEDVVVNLLFSEGRIDGGRHGQQVGPNGAVRTFEDWRRRRTLEPAERATLEPLLADPNRRLWIEEMAADFDTAERVAAGRTVDLLLLRIDPLDPATHSGYGATATGDRDDGTPWLYDFYRYADRRLADVASALDGDDLLVVMSDHGIRTAMEHSPWAVFIAAGEGVPRGRAPGTPKLRTVPRLLADWLGTQTDWPMAEDGWRPAAVGPEAR